MPDPVARTDNGNDAAINIRSPCYFLARTVGRCWYCNASTLLLALAVPPGHQALELDDEARDDETPEDTWIVASHNAFLFFIEYIPDVIRRRLNAFTQSYRFGYSEAAVEFYWANHCERCGCLLDDHELFCEPDGAFLPATEANARVVRLLAVDDAIEAAAAGYAYEPQFFDAMSRG